MKLEITADWVLCNLSGAISRTIDTPGYVCLCAYNEFSYHMIELTLQQMGVEFEQDEFEEAGSMTNTFKFDFEKSKKECPEFYNKYQDIVYQ